MLVVLLKLTLLGGGVGVVALLIWPMLRGAYGKALPYGLAGLLGVVIWLYGHFATQGAEPLLTSILGSASLIGLPFGVYLIQRRGGKPPRG